MTEPRSSFPAPTDRYTLGPSKLLVSPYCLGMVSDPNTIPAAFDAGINFFFVSADMHWPIYEGARKGLQMLFERGGDIRDQVVVGAVSYSTQTEFCTMPFEEVLAFLPGVKRLDLLVAGGAKGGEFLERWPVYQEHLQSSWCGCRAIGASFHIRQTALSAINYSMVDIAFVRYNTAHTSAKEDLFPHLKERPRALVYNFTNTWGCPTEAQWQKLQLGEDYWRPSVPDYYRFALSRPELDGLLFSLNSEAELKSTLKALQEGPLSPEEEEHMVNLTGMAQGTTRLKEEIESDTLG